MGSKFVPEGGIQGSCCRERMCMFELERVVQGGYKEGPKFSGEREVERDPL